MELAYLSLNKNMRATRIPNWFQNLIAGAFDFLAKIGL